MPFLRGAFLKAAHRPNRLYCRIDPFPYLALALVLLSFFMILPSPSRHRVVEPVNVISAKPQSGAVREDALRVTILRDGAVYFQNLRIRLDVLPNRLRDATLNGAEQKVYLLVDARARYGDVQPVLALIRLTGIQKVGFLTN